MSERVLHEWTERGGWIRQISSDGKSERGRKDTGRPDSWTLWMTPLAPETEEIARLASRVTELEAENAKLMKCVEAADKMRGCLSTEEWPQARRYDAARVDLDKPAETVADAAPGGLA